MDATKRVGILVLLSLGFIVFAIANVLASSLDEAAAATFKLWNGDRAVCSAVYIGKGNSGEDDYFLTAAHCVNSSGDKYNIRAEVLDDKLKVLKQTAYFVKVERSLKNKDVALLRALAAIEAAPAPADIAQPGEFSGHLGEVVAAIGYPHTDILTVTMGEFTGLARGILHLESPLYRATPAIAPGSSGGGLWAPVGGTWKLIGTASALRRDSEFMNYFSTPDKIADLLRFYSKFSPAKGRP